MNIKNKNIGIWGLGVVGKSAVHYLHAQGANLQVLDSRTLTNDEQDFLSQYAIPWFTANTLLPFLEHNEFILPSPGIDLRPYVQYQSKWLSELDLFRSAYTKPIIAITGSIGKTSVTHLLSAILNNHFHVVTGGNIGTAMFDLLNTPSDRALLEVSSFQLDLCKTFAPDLAIWTNFYPNHLDRHGTEEDYFWAKYKIFEKILENQNNQQQIVIPYAIYKKLTKDDTVKSLGFRLHEIGPKSTKGYDAHGDQLQRISNISIFSLTKPSDTQLASIDPAYTLFYIDNGHIMMRRNNQETTLIALSKLPEASFVENWLIIYAALTLLNIPLTTLADIADTLTVPEHRLEKVATINNIIFYNDSKSTTPQSTLAAINQLKGSPIHLFVGGISKGINREDFIKQLQGQVQQVHCFGKESEQLYAWCMDRSIPATCSTTLEDAFTACTQQSAPGQQILFSPAGASFDLFKDYKERGNRFKELVHLLSTKF